MNLRFGEHVEVKDVPALTQDLSGLCAPDGRADQAPPRREPPAPRARDVRSPRRSVRRPQGTSRPRPRKRRACRSGTCAAAGCWCAPASRSTRRTGRSSSSIRRRCSRSPSTTRSGRRPGSTSRASRRRRASANVKEGIVPMFKFAGFDLPQIPAVEGAPVDGPQGERGRSTSAASSARVSSRSSA